jgi:predicted RND superfamily exporter protein
VILRGYLVLVLRHRAAALVLMGALTVLAGVEITRGVFATSLITSFLGESGAYERYRDESRRFQHGDFMAVAVESPNHFTPEGWSRIERVTRELETAPAVQRVYSVWNAIRVRVDGDALDVRPYHDVVAASGDYSELRQELLRDPALRRVLVAEDGQSTLFLLELRPYDREPVEKMPATLEAIHRVFTDQGFPAQAIHIAGLYPETVEGIKESRYSVAVILPFTILILLGIVYLLFWQFWPVLITGVVAVVSTVWTFAFAILVEPRVNILLSVVPAVMIIVSFSDIIHLCSRYALLVRKGYAREAAVLEAVSEVGLACFFNSVTLGIGFVSMAFVPAPVFRLVSLVLGAGVVIAFGLAMTLVPILLSLVSAPAAAPERATTKVEAGLDAVIRFCTGVGMRHPWAMVLAFALTLGIAAAGISRIRLETSMLDRLSPGNALHVARRFLNQHYEGTTFVDVYVQAPVGTDWVDAGAFARLATFQERLAALPGVDGAQSFVSVVNTVDSAARSAEERAREKPSSGLLGQYLELAESVDAGMVSRLLDAGHTHTRFLVRLRHSGMAESAVIAKRIEALGAELLPPGSSVFASGLTPLFGSWIDEVAKGQRDGLGFALLVTALTMVVCFRSLRLGLVSMIPNIHPIVMLAGYVGYMWPTVDSDVIVIAMIATGVVEDDTIHFVTCLLLEARKTTNLDEALRRTFALTGRSVLKTTAILCLGFLPFALSGYSTIRHMGTLLPLTFVSALLADLFFLPALVRLGLLRVPLAHALDESK